MGASVLISSTVLLHRITMKSTILFVMCFVAYTNAASINKEPDCRALAERCRASGDRESEACKEYMEQCRRDGKRDIGEMLNKYMDKYCDELAKKCKAGDKKACELYKMKCEKDGKLDIGEILN